MLCVFFRVYGVRSGMPVDGVISAATPLSRDLTVQEKLEKIHQ